MPERVACVEDYDSDQSSAVPGTLVAAQTGRPASSRPQKAVGRSRSRAPPPASDSGYSSHASASSATTKSSVPPRVLDPPARAAVQPPVVSSPTKSSKSKPQIHRIDSGRSTRAQTVSSPAVQDGRRCSDPNCNHPDCGVVSTNTERRYTLPERVRQPQQQPRSQPQAQAQSQQLPPYATPPYPQPSYTQYAQPPPMQAPPTMMAPPAVPRQRTESMSRARPVSMHGYNLPSYTAGAAGPPPSASAYYQYSQPAYPSQTPAYAGTMAPPQVMDYPPPSPVVPASPSSPSMNTYGAYPGFSGHYSARQANPNVPGLEIPKPMPQAGLTRTVSTRRPSERPSHRRSSAYIEETASYSESTIESDSEDDVEYERRHYPRDSRRESRTLAVAAAPARRPSTNKKYVSEPVVPRVRDSRDLSRIKTAQSDKYIDYPSSSEFNDSDRTARAVIHGGRKSDRGSRRPSVSSKGSSTRTKPSSLSSVTDYSRVIVEGPNGRRVAYLSKEEQADVIRQYQRQKLEDKLEEQRIAREKVEAYQKTVSGGTYELTAENIKNHANRKSRTASHISGRSHKSSNSGSKMSKAADGVRIESGGTVVHVYGETMIEVRASEDGGPAHFVIGSSTGKESSYLTSSKGSSTSRVGRPQRRQRTSEEDGYEPAL